MYDWRIPCNKAARRFVKDQSLTIDAKDYGHLEHFHYGGEQVCKDIIQSLDLESSDRILDAGCGIGGSTRTLSRLNYSVVGVDANAGFIRFAESISDEQFVSGDTPAVFKHSRLEELSGLQYDAWFALLVFVHIADREALFGKMEHDCSKKGRYFIETIVCNSQDSIFETPTWTEAELTRLASSAQVSSKTALWKKWTKARLERFLLQRRFFKGLYGEHLVEERVRHYEKIAEGFQTGVLKGRRLIGHAGFPVREMEMDFDKTCIIEFDQRLDIT